jgi:hypothetical protein
MRFSAAASTLTRTVRNPGAMATAGDTRIRNGSRPSSVEAPKTRQMDKSPAPQCCLRIAVVSGHILHSFNTEKYTNFTEMM